MARGCVLNSSDRNVSHIHKHASDVEEEREIVEERYAHTNTEHPHCRIRHVQVGRQGGGGWLAVAVAGFGGRGPGLGPCRAT